MSEMTPGFKKYFNCFRRKRCATTTNATVVRNGTFVIKNDLKTIKNHPSTTTQKQHQLPGSIPQRNTRDKREGLVLTSIRKRNRNVDENEEDDEESDDDDGVGSSLNESDSNDSEFVNQRFKLTTLL